ncbi:MAG: MoxR family ATPase [Acidobacteriota bacterium]
MDEPQAAPSTTIDQLAEAAETVLATVDQHVLGQRSAAEMLLAAYMSGGHVLLEGVPGIGKTLLAHTFAATLGTIFHRIQFTPDLMPADVVGTNIFDPSEGGFHLVKGPVFTEVLMADEINRTPPKTQAALLEAMQEGQVTIDGETHRLDRLFFVVATQNPVEHEGTYPLPEAQLDRFTCRIDMGLPSPEDEIEMFRRAASDTLTGWGRGNTVEPVVGRHLTWPLRNASRHVHVADDMLGYLAGLAAAVRNAAEVELAPSPRAALALLELSRAMALLDGRDFIAPDDLKRALVPCWSHRVLLTAEAELEGHEPRQLLTRLAETVEVPH